MNIIKFKDVMIEESTLDPQDIELFNTKMRGKYCWCVNWKYCVSFDDMTVEEYTHASQVGQPEVSLELYLDLSEVRDLVDHEATELINSIDSYKVSNQYVPSELTLAQIKKFRTAVAEGLLVAEEAWDTEYDVMLSEKIEAMLTYYAKGMYDDIIAAMTMFANNEASVSVNGTYTDCGCGGTTSQLGIQTNGVTVTTSAKNCGCSSANAQMSLASVCDCISIYRVNIYNFMVDVFSDYRFWSLVSDTVVADMISMLRGILEAGLSLSFDSNDVLFGDCSCLGDTTDTSGKLIINNLIKALEYIQNEEVVAHKNFIKNSLYAWASKLYEHMEW